MHSRWGGVFVALLIAGGCLVGAAPRVSAAAPPVAGVGGAACAVHSGKVSFKPKLTATPQTNVVATFNLTLKPCIGETGLPASTVTGATLKAVSAPFTASCGTPAPAALTATAKWKAKKAKLATSTIVWSTSSGDVNDINLAAPGAITGSYAGDTAALTLTRAKSADCSKGIANWNVSGTLDVQAPCSTYGPADAFGTATGANGNEWLVVVPAHQYPDRCHPTGTMTYAWNHIGCNGASNVALGDAITRAASTSQPVTNESDFWGVDTGLAPSAAGTCGGFAVREYSGDAVYGPLSELPPCGTNMATSLGGAALSSTSPTWYVIVPSAPFSDACHPTGTLSVSVVTQTCGTLPFSTTALQDSGLRTASIVSSGASVPSPIADYWGLNTGISPQNGGLCGVTAVHATYSGDSHFAGFSI